MDFNATVDLIIRELEEAREIIDDLKKFPGAPALQIELAKSKCRSAAEVIAMLKNMQEVKHKDEEDRDTHPHAAVTGKKKEPEPEHHDPEPEKEHEHKHEHGHKHEGEQKQEDEHKHPAIDENTIAEEHPKKPYVAPIIADTFSHLANRFNEQMGESQGDDFSYMHGKKYDDLSEAIGVNDRFYYIREIFNGNRESYNEAISRLGNAHNLKEARSILAEYKNEKTSDEAVKQLLDLTRRKFGSDE
jgi:hypothetical protein